MNMKNATPLQDEPHLIFGVRVLLVEAIEHRGEIRRIGVNIDDIGRHKAATLF